MASTASARSSALSSEHRDLRLGLFILALASTIAPLVAFSQTPSSTLYNQLAALFGWGAALLFLAENVRRLRVDAVAAALLLLIAAPLASVAMNGHPLGLALQPACMLAATLAVYLCAAGLRDDLRERVFDWFCLGLLIAGLASLVISLLQVFAPGLTNGWLIAHSGLPGRAIGNMRQPNHLASLMMWACVAATWLCDRGCLRHVGKPLLPLLLAGFVFVIVLSASRTGMWAGVPMLVLWGLIDARLQRHTRIALGATALMFGLSWWGMDLWAHAGHVFGAQVRLEGEGAGSPSRLAILSNAWELVKRNPWAGVGWGEFNLAWSMTPFPGRPIAFFDHTHNILMQFAVELGLPATALITALLLYGLWRMLALTLKARDSEAVMRSSALMIVLVIGVHSLTEYPLWYAYFLLPAAFAMGMGAKSGDAPAQKPSATLLTVAGALILAGTLYAAWDYRRIVAIYAPAAGDAPLAQRVKAGQQSTFFSALADYAAATSLPGNTEALAATRRTAHNLIDGRLMKEWAEHLHRAHDDDRARYIVQRLKEFRSTEGKTWLAECEMPGAADMRPFQCEPPQRDYEWRELR